MGNRGIDISDLPPLVKVDPEFDEKPLYSFDGYEAMGPKALEAVHHYYGDRSFDEICHEFTRSMMRNLSFDQLCKVKHSTSLMLHSSICDQFRSDPPYSVFQKVTNSMWRWGYTRAGWNEVVDCFEGLPRFNLGDDFTITLDHTTGYNECGYSQYTRTFLDGVLGYLVHYKGEHVMTIGFSFVGGYRILVQQIQLKKQRGNRFLFKMPNNRVEFILERFNIAFPQHTLYIVDGDNITSKSLNIYIDALKHARQRVKDIRISGIHDSYDEEDMRISTEHIEILTKKIAHLKNDGGRLRDFYASTGRFQRGEVLNINKINHYRINA